MKKRAFFFSALLFSLMICQCAAVGKKVEIRPIWESGSAYIRLFNELGKPLGHDHPVEFHEEELRRVLQSLFFSRYEYFHWSTASRVFSEVDIRDLARFFQQAFREAGPNEVVEFYLPDRSRKLFGISSRIVVTRGRSFVKGGAIHFQFDNVQEEMTASNSRPEEEGQRAEVAWKLVPQEGQQYDTERDFLGNEPPNLRWVRVDLKTFTTPTSGPNPLAGGAAAPTAATPAPGKVEAQAAPAPPPTALPPAAPTPEPAARERLRELKQMLDEGLISPQDYEKKKKEILDAL